MISLPQENFRGKIISFEQYLDLLTIGMAGHCDELMSAGQPYAVDGMVNYNIVGKRLGLIIEDGWIEDFGINMENHVEALITHDSPPDGQEKDGHWVYLNSGFDRIAKLLHEKYYERSTHGDDKNIFLPKQETSIQFGISDSGNITIVKQTGEADESRIELMRPALQKLLTSAESELNHGNKAFGFLADALADYRAEVEKPAAQIEFGLVFALGCQIDHALKLAKEKTEDAEFADLPDLAAIKVDALLDAHRPFMMASKLGAELVVDNELFNESPEEQRESNENIAIMGDAFSTISDVTDTGTYDIIQKTLRNRAEATTIKEQIFSRRVAKNLCIVVAGISAIAAPPIAGAAMGGIAAGGAGTVIGVITSFFVNKSILESGEDLKNVITPSMQQKFLLIREFTLKNADVLTKSAKISGDASWFKKIIDKQRKGKIRKSELRMSITQASEKARKYKLGNQLSTLRLLNARIKDADITAASKERPGGISDMEIYSLIRKMIKQRKESSEIYSDNGRHNLAKRELEEIGIISQFLSAEDSPFAALASLKKES